MAHVVLQNIQHLHTKYWVSFVTPKGLCSKGSLFQIFHTDRHSEVPLVLKRVFIPKGCLFQTENKSCLINALKLIPWRFSNSPNVLFRITTNWNNDLYPKIPLAVGLMGYSSKELQYNTLQFSATSHVSALLEKGTVDDNQLLSKGYFIQ